MIRRILFVILFVLGLATLPARASHIVGGDFTYLFLGDTTIGGELYQQYKVSLYIYEDCITGSPEAIADDNPAYLTVYKVGLEDYFRVDSTYYNSIPGSGGAITVPANFSNDCITNIPPVCLLRKRFEKTYTLKPNPQGYFVVYERCCRNASIINILAPAEQGAAYFCYIPPGSLPNNSAVFKNYPPQIICLNNPLNYDHSATDADGDSLTYNFGPAYIYNSNEIKPIVATIPQAGDTVSYTSTFSSQTPISGFPPIEIDPETGIITGTPNRIGRYLVTICCNEWRHGQLINTTRREFQFVVTDCSKKVVADIPVLSNSPNTYIINCKDYLVNFINTSTGGFAYRWNFGLEGTAGDTSTNFEPSFTYPDTGTYTVKLIVNPGTTCPDSISRLVKIYPTFVTNFTDSGIYCPGGSIFFADKSVTTIKPVNYWKWDFGDGTNSTDQNPTHKYGSGGTFNVILTAENIKNCRDTTMHRIVVQQFRPFAGDDTIIVKGEYIQFDAHGGIKYSWAPANQLTDTSISNPIGNYPDTGTFIYRVFVRSEYGCSGYDTVKVLVVNKAYFTVPTAFTPNGDGLNDIFRPLAVGYSKLKYFRVFNRWGEEVYYGNTLEQGWDGTWGGKPAEMGVYYWQMEFIDRLGKNGYLKGDVTLIR